MSDDLRAWLNELRSRGIGSETAALLIDKCEELAEAFGGVRSTLEMIMSGDLTTALPPSAINMLAEACYEINMTLRAPGGGES